MALAEMEEKVREGVEEVERLMMEERYNSAREALVEMRNEYPSMVKHIGSMLSVCEVLTASKMSVPGLGVDHYWVLSASPFQKPSQISARYHHIMDSLAPLLDSKFPAAHRALQAVSTAFSLLSDHHKRSAFDSLRNAAWECLPLQPCCSTSHFLHSHDYFDFDYHRECTHSHLEQPQIWAAKFATTYRYGRASLSSHQLICVTWLRPIPISARERRWCQSGLPVSCGTFELGPESETTSDLASAIYNCNWVRGLVEDQFKIFPRRGEVWAIYKDWDIDEWAYRGSDILRQCKFELVEITSDFSNYTRVDCAYLVKVDGFRYIFTQRKPNQAAQDTGLHISPAMLYMFSHKVPAYRFTGGEIDGVTEGMLELDRVALPDCIIDDSAADTEEEKIESLSNLSSLKPHGWSAKDFGVGQIWALRCWDTNLIVSQDQYAKIENVISDNSQVHVTVLEPLVSGLLLFKESTSSVNVEVSRLSYAVKWRQISDQVYEIQNPKKGEIWAVHEECNGGEYEVVQIVSDMSEGDGGILQVARLEEVKGCLTFFQRQRQECQEVNVRSNVEELSGFSHRIPAFRVPGIGRHGVPESTWHLEPNALPLILNRNRNRNTRL